MKRIIFALLVLAFLALSPTARAQVKRLNPDAVNLNMDITKLTVEELRLYRNAIYARHCYWFEDGHLRGEFQDYEEKKCGNDLYWDKAKKPFDASVLAPDEQKFVARVKAREDELRAGQVKMVNGAPVYNRRAAVNFSQFSTLPPAALDRLFQNGFVVLPGKQEQLFHVYEENDYRMVPNFVTTDSVLQLYHLYFDFTLREIEENKLLPAAAALSQGMVDKLKARYDKVKGTREAEPLKRALLYFAVAQDLTIGDPKEDKPAEDDSAMFEETGPLPLVSKADFNRPAPAWMEETWKKDFLAQRRLILQAQGKVKGPIMGTVDYTMFKPRGHYTRSLKLARYFRTMMWLGMPGFILDNKTMPVETALFIVYDLTHSPELKTKYDLIYDPTSFYVGPTDDLTPALVRSVAEEICGQDAPLESWLAKKEEIRKEAVKRNPVRIRTNFGDDRDLPQLRVMGMRYIPDGEILQRLTDYQFRPVPMGLDIFGVMGVPAALDILKNSKIAWTGYWPEMAKMQAEFKDLKPKDGEPNLYWRWLHLLKTLNQPAPSGAAPFMRTAPWEAKNLNTALASWTELRHDTILYAKPSGAEGGGGEMPPRVAGYVEARPDFFNELVELQRYTSSQLKSRGLLTVGLENVAGEMEELFAFLARTSQKEVEGKALTDAEYERVRGLGGWLEYLTIRVLTDRSVSWFEVTGPDRFLAVVADVGTFAGKALEEGVGYADELYALVELNGYLYITRGAVFSYYEFLQPAGNRLTDEQWQQMLRQNQAPARPTWTQRFFLNQGIKALPDRYTYSSGG